MVALKKVAFICFMMKFGDNIYYINFDACSDKVVKAVLDSILYQQTSLMIHAYNKDSVINKSFEIENKQIYKDVILNYLNYIKIYDAWTTDTYTSEVDEYMKKMKIYTAKEMIKYLWSIT